MKKFYFFLLAMLFSVVAFAYDAEVEGIYYNLNDKNKTAEVTQGSYTQTEITIPSKVTYNSVEYSVTSIGNNVFEYCSSLTSITIPNSVIRIGNNVFECCSSLTSITIPNSVITIGYRAFAYCRSLISISIPNSVTTIEEDLFYSCSSLTSILIGSSVTTIGDHAFSGCSSLTSINVDENNQNYASVDGVLYNKDVTTLILCPKGKTEVTTPNSVITIGDYAFSGCSSLTTVTIGNSITAIGNYAFDACLSLATISFSNSVTSIGEGAFSRCSSLSYLEIPNSVTSIGDYAFPSCTSLTSIEIPNSVTSIGDGAFEECSSLTSITIPNSVTSIGVGAFAYCESLTSITIGNSVTSIGDYVFFECPSLTSITIPSSVISIGTSAFYGCTSLTSIEIPNGVTTIGNGAFYGCTSLLSIIMQGATPPTIGEETFYEVSRGVAIKIPCGSINSYKTAEYWSEFVNYVENSAILTVVSNDKNMGFATVTKRNTCDDDVAQVQAQALPGYKFVRWSDGSTENPRIIVVTEDIKLSATFELDETTLIEKTQITSANVYSHNGILHVEGAETDYYVLDMAGRLIYSGRDTELQLPRGVYVVNVGGEVQKVVL